MKAPVLLVAVCVAVFLMGCKSTTTAVYLVAPKELSGAIISVEGKEIGKIGKDGWGTFSLPYKRNEVTVAKDGYEPIVLVVDTSDGAGEIYPHIEEHQVRKSPERKTSAPNPRFQATSALTRRRA